MIYTAHFTDGSVDTYESTSDWDAVTTAKRHFADRDGKQLTPEAVYVLDESTGRNKLTY